MQGYLQLNVHWFVDQIITFDTDIKSEENIEIEVTVMKDATLVS